MKADFPFQQFGNLEASWLNRARTAYSMCTGSGTAECSRAVVQRLVHEFPLAGSTVSMDIRTVAMWDSGFGQMNSFLIGATYVSQFPSVLKQVL